ncbi:MAG: molybdopterin biosynthesis protein [Chitinophagaceae bacterium BSSC1]|nr:MAG: molybdopterin biosynthesis protein [Chitinophagaceae bacterium BSSC1]
MILPGFGLAAQGKLAKAKVLIVGIGALGCPALQYLVGAGVGQIGMVDPDAISESNLHRQLLYGQADIGKSKVAIAAGAMRLQNPAIKIKTYPVAIVRQNALDLMKGYDLVIDATDNFQAKYLLNDAAAILKIPLIYGAVTRYQGQVSVFHFPDQEGVSYNYRDLFPIEPADNIAGSCESLGVIGVLPGIIGCLQAAEAIKIITGIGRSLAGRLYTHDFLETSNYEIAILKNEEVKPLTREAFLITENQSSEYWEEIDVDEITVDAFLKLKTKEQVFVLDVRESEEYPAIDFSDAQIPMSELIQKLDLLPNKEICVICHQGIRSVYAAQLIQAKKGLKTYSLKGGITAYFNKLT